ncbi:hypothetical protein LX32DRAFT_646592 [Colletotrichum zoysiae]|uniref:Uncharacterized protein n=1 Tax=Colletotrichum zoysiae TaxID=1216348 RepID=A0AAD9H383_9PEZI|nr:hypothetical protein LX32DRAFT_646592 [Colletotrichum zoysiae]
MRLSLLVTIFAASALAAPQDYACVCKKGLEKTRRVCQHRVAGGKMMGDACHINLWDTHTFTNACGRRRGGHCEPRMSAGGTSTKPLP